MKIKVYVNYIFPAWQEVNNTTGELIDGPVMTNNILNWPIFDWLDWLVQSLIRMAYDREGLEPMFECRIKKRDAKILKQKWPQIYAKSSNT